MRDYELDRAGHHTPHREPEAKAPEAAGPAPVPARSPALNAGSVMHLQRVAGNQSVVQLLAGDEERSPVHDVVGSGGGAPLDDATRTGMESAFGTDFGNVRVHTDEQASKSAEAVGAHAYTVGSDVVFRSGQYNPSTPTGQRTIAHELAHVVQQSQGPVDGTDAGGGIRLSDPSDRYEQAAETTADQVMSSVQTSRSAPAANAGTAVQLLEDEAVPAVQREEEPEEEEQQG